MPTNVHELGRTMNIQEPSRMKFWSSRIVYPFIRQYFLKLNSKLNLNCFRKMSFLSLQMSIESTLFLIILLRRASSALRIKFIWENLISFKFISDPSDWKVDVSSSFLEDSWPAELSLVEVTSLIWMLDISGSMNECLFIRDSSTIPLWDVSFFGVVT